MKVRNLLLSAVASVSVALFIGSTAAAERPDIRADVLALEAPPMGPAQACVSCLSCAGAKHKMRVVDDIETDIYIIAHGCDTGGDHDCWQHPDCEPALALDGEELGKLWAALSTFEGDRLERVLLSYRELVTYNEDRQAVQFNSSCGAVTAHLPLTPRQIRSLSS